LTCTPGITAPEGSIAVPDIDPLDTCARASPPVKRISAKTVRVPHTPRRAARLEENVFTDSPFSIFLRVLLAVGERSKSRDTATCPSWFEVRNDLQSKTRRTLYSPTPRKLWRKLEILVSYRQSLSERHARYIPTLERIDKHKILLKGKMLALVGSKADARNY